MARSAAWSSVVDEKWRDQWQAHRTRLQLIESAKSVSPGAFSSALAASAHPPRAQTNSKRRVKRSKSQAAKTRQEQIDRDNLLLIKKIIAIDNAIFTTSSSKKHDSKQHKHRKSSVVVKNTIIVPTAAHSNHECLHPLPQVPQSATCHVLYTRGSATMNNNFVSYNAPSTTKKASATARVRSQAQSKILEENKRILGRILATQSTIDHSDLKRHQERYNRLRITMSRYYSTSSLLPKQNYSQSLPTSCSQGTLSENAKVRETSDSIVHFNTNCTIDQSEQQRERRLRATTKGSFKAYDEVSCPLPGHITRNSDSLVSRMRKLAIESQHTGSDIDYMW